VHAVMREESGDPLVENATATAAISPVQTRVHAVDLPLHRQMPERVTVGDGGVNSAEHAPVVSAGPAEVVDHDFPHLGLASETGQHVVDVGSANGARQPPDASGAYRGVRRSVFEIIGRPTSCRCLIIALHEIRVSQFGIFSPRSQRFSDARS
jgi:hypothetical protein